MNENGVVNFLKPAGMTSHDCVYYMRKITGIKRIGHTGTLDPMAAGVLPICIGKATRIMDYLDLDHKTYRCEMILGLVTDTWDIWGNVQEDRRGRFTGPDIDAVNEVFKSFDGEIFQSTPRYSSVRVAGKRLYEYAREGLEIDVGKRPVIIHNIEVLKYDKINGRIVFDLVCSKGTYVRSICHEAGEMLGCGGSMSFLLRMGSGIFTIDGSNTPETLHSSWQEHLLPMDYALTHLGILEIKKERESWFCNGGYLGLNDGKVIRQPCTKGISKHIRIREGLDLAYKIYSEDKFLGVALYDKDEKKYIADKVLCR